MDRGFTIRFNLIRTRASSVYTFSPFFFFLFFAKVGNHFQITFLFQQKFRTSVGNVQETH